MSREQPGENPVRWTIWDDHEVVQRAIKESSSIKETLNRLGLNSTWGSHSYSLFHEYVRDNGINTSHFKARSRNAQTQRNNGDKRRIPISEILEGKHPNYPTSKLAKRLIAEAVLEKKCAQCGITTWMGRKLSLHLDHADGNKRNHRLENLRFLCPNCHSQTETYAGRNKKMKKHGGISEAELLGAIRRAPSIHAALKHVGLHPTGANYRRATMLLEKVKEKSEKSAGN